VFIMTLNAKELYKDYWCGVAKEREKSCYYERLYAHLVRRIEIEATQQVLDVAGGNGQLLRYFGINHGDILDISESGQEEARNSGFNAIYGDIEDRFPIEKEKYDAAFCFEVLEHLHYPNKTLAEINNVLKSKGVLYLGQPNMRADGVYHVRRYYLQELLRDLAKTGFAIEWVDYVPAYSVRSAILSDIRKNPSWIRKIIQCVNLLLSYLPWRIRYQLAHWMPDRFALIFAVKAVKKSRE
jgi:SAM-dependent methyltransferase